MERVTFLVERTGERIPCLLNPESLEVRRSAGIVRRRGVGGAVIGNPRTDDPLIATGGGVTEYELKLLFDVELMPGTSESGAIAPIAAPAPVPSETALAGLTGDETGDTGTTEQETPEEPAAEPPAEAIEPVPPSVPAAPPSIDVRTLTQPLWALAENGDPIAGNLALPVVRLIWGCSWNVAGVILAVAERLECFDPHGVPKRSWLSLLMRRVEDQMEAGNASPPPTSRQFEINPSGSGTDESGDDSVMLPVDEDGTALTPLYLVAADRYGDPRYDRAIAEYNDLDDLLELEQGQAIRLPPASAVVAA
jgi:hypothetical protein